MRQPATAFTLQMLTVSSEARAVSFVNARRDVDRFALYRVQRNGQVFFVVVYGIYDSREEAQNVAASLPDSFRNITPWARPLSQIQDAIRTALQQ
jgi:DamX protein